MHAADAEAPLINDAQFLEELERFERTDEGTPDSRLDALTYDEAVDALDEGLPVASAARPFAVPEYERPAPVELREPVPAQFATERRVPFVAAALVIVGCLTAGAATAAYVFQDRVAQITAPHSARP